MTEVVSKRTVQTAVNIINTSPPQKKRPVLAEAAESDWLFDWFQLSLLCCRFIRLRSSCGFNSLEGRMRPPSSVELGPELWQELRFSYALRPCWLCTRELFLSQSLTVSSSRCSQHSLSSIHTPGFLTFGRCLSGILPHIEPSAAITCFHGETKVPLADSSCCVPSLQWAASLRGGPVSLLEGLSLLSPDSHSAFTLRWRSVGKRQVGADWLWGQGP